MSTSRRQTTTENLRTSARRVLVMGPSGSGKSTLSASASRFAGDVLPLAKPIVAKDVAVFQGDTEGMAGARAIGIEIPNIFEYTHCNSWKEYEKQLLSDLAELRPEVERGEIKVLIVDLALPDVLIVKHVAPKTINDWQQVKILGLEFFKAFQCLVGCTVIGNAQIRAAESPVETPQARTAMEAQGSGTERATFTIDLSKGVGAVWKQHNSLTITTERKAVRTGVGKDAVTSIEGKLYCQPNKRYEAKSRFGDLLAPVEPFNQTLRALMARAYGDAL